MFPIRGDGFFSRMLLKPAPENEKRVCKIRYRSVEPYGFLFVRSGRQTNFRNYTYTYMYTAHFRCTTNVLCADHTGFGTAEYTLRANIYYARVYICYLKARGCVSTPKHIITCMVINSIILFVYTIWIKLSVFEFMRISNTMQCVIYIYTHIYIYV